MLRGFNVQPQNAGSGQIFCASGAVTPGLYSGTAQTGPLLWNGSAVGGGRGVTAYLLALSYGMTVASTVAGALGLTGAAGQPAAPTSITSIGVVGNLRVGGPAPQCTAYNAGTVVNAGTFFLPTGQAGTAALTAEIMDDNFIHLGGVIAVPTSAWAAVAATAALTGATIDVGLVWLEVPND
jgi:hypothetical protein